jgi:hypothetical protein
VFISFTVPFPGLLRLVLNAGAPLGESQFLNQRADVVFQRGLDETEGFRPGGAAQQETAVNHSGQLCPALASQLVFVHQDVGIIDVGERN